MATNPEVFDFDIGDVTGEKGDTGNGIESIELLSTSGLNKTYRITMTDDTTFDFVVTDGNGISGASFDAQTNALTLTFDNGTSFTTPSLKGVKGDKGDTGETGPRGIPGETGPTGATGATGATPNLTVGNVQTLEPWQQATAEITGTPEDPVLNLGIPRGGEMNIVNLSGTQITQVGADNTFYVCGELTELTFTASAVGITMIRFTSGTTPTVLTVNGVTSWMFDNDPTAASLEANKTYDINVLNGVGVVGWA